MNLTAHLHFVTTPPDVLVQARGRHVVRCPWCKCRRISNGSSAGVLRIERGVGVIFRPENRRCEFAGMAECPTIFVQRKELVPQSAERNLTNASCAMSVRPVALSTTSRVSAYSPPNGESRRWLRGRGMTVGRRSYPGDLPAHRGPCVRAQSPFQRDGPVSLPGEGPRSRCGAVYRRLGPRATARCALAVVVSLDRPPGLPEEPASFAMRSASSSGTVRRRPGGGFASFSVSAARAC
jgi:hypothetical protein